MSQKGRAGPSMTIKRQPIAKCDSCGGEGIIKGLFHEMPCNHCEGAGIVHGETGEAMDPQEVILQLRLRLNKAAQVVHRLREQVADQPEDRGYRSQRVGADGRLTRVYHGD